MKQNYVKCASWVVGVDIAICTSERRDKKSILLFAVVAVVLFVVFGMNLRDHVVVVVFLVTCFFSFSLRQTRLYLYLRVCRREYGEYVTMGGKIFSKEQRNIITLYVIQ